MIEYADLGVCGWPYVICSESDAVTVDGVDVWDESRWPSGEHIGFVTLAEGMNPIRVYEVELNSKKVRVASGELSNGVYVFASNDVPVETTTLSEE